MPVPLRVLANHRALRSLASTAIAVAVAFITTAFGSKEEGNLTLAAAQSDARLKIQVSTDGRSQIVIHIAHRASEPIAIDIPANLVVKGEKTGSAATIRQATLRTEAGQESEAIIPAVPLSAGNGAGLEPATIESKPVPALEPLCAYSASHNDLPRATAQSAALLLLEDIRFPQWQEFLRRESTKDPRPTPADIAALVDALALAQALAPGKVFSIRDDADFRLRALRNPWSRAKAMQLFEMTPPEGVPVPDVNQLLHTNAGDNCPICRLRAKSADPSNGL